MEEISVIYQKFLAQNIGIKFWLYKTFVIFPYNQKKGVTNKKNPNSCAREVLVEVERYDHGPGVVWEAGPDGRERAGHGGVRHRHV